MATWGVYNRELVNAQRPPYIYLCVYISTLNFLVTLGTTQPPTHLPTSSFPLPVSRLSPATPSHQQQSRGIESPLYSTARALLLLPIKSFAQTYFAPIKNLLPLFFYLVLFFLNSIFLFLFKLLDSFKFIFIFLKLSLGIFFKLGEHKKFWQLYTSTRGTFILFFCHSESTKNSVNEQKKEYVSIFYFWIPIYSCSTFTSIRNLNVFFFFGKQIYLFFFFPHHQKNY